MVENCVPFSSRLAETDAGEQAAGGSPGAHTPFAAFLGAKTVNGRVLAAISAVFATRKSAQHPEQALKQVPAAQNRRNAMASPR
jgi:hypothetical protein